MFKKEEYVFEKEWYVFEKKGVCVRKRGMCLRNRCSYIIHHILFNIIASAHAHFH